ncbi:MAG: hypothetical protein IJ960_07765 [Oscillospiraceae bacterium]|nr:hypothetical protein [Oscillospiraceae bacterium]
MRKKHDEGYALVFVLVVMVVLSLIAISLMTAALKNLQNQKATVAQMEAKYEAQGEMEKTIAQVTDRLSTLFGATGESNSLNTTTSVFREEIQARFQDLVLNNLGVSYNVESVAWDGMNCKVGFTRQDAQGKVSVSCVLVLENAVRTEAEGAGSVYFLNQPSKITYESYTVTYLNPSEPEEGGDA